MILAMSAQGEFRFMVTKGCVGATQFIELNKRLLHGAQHMTFLIVDGRPAHKAKCVIRFVKSMKDRFRLFFLPPYSPELNPDEQVWNDLKKNAVARQAVSSFKELHRKVGSESMGLPFIFSLYSSVFSPHLPLI